MKQLDYSVLREIQKKEMESTTLVHFDEDFYIRASEFLKGKKEAAFSSGSTQAIREYENIKRMINAIKERREEKIILMAIRGEESRSGLAPEEEEMLNGLSDCIRKFRDKIGVILAEEKKAMIQKRNVRRIKFLRNVEPYKGIDNNVYGPFKNGEEIELPADEAEWLLKAKIAESI